MPHIFDEVQDIGFGGSESTSPRDSRSFISAKESQLGSPMAVRRESGFRPSVGGEKRTPKSRPEAVGPFVPKASDTKNNLEKLVESMKPSYLPRDFSGTRIVAMSSSLSTDPMFLFRSGEETLVLGMGVGTTDRAGEAYATFPDMRLPVGEKDRLSGWILLQPVVSIEVFMLALESLGFPHVYGTRSIIAYLRENIVDQNFLGKCRFFELFPGSDVERNIGSFRIEKASDGISINTLGKTIGYLKSGGIMPQEDGQYVFDGIVFSVGDILQIDASLCTKHSLRFTFDTFYLDQKSVGVIAGYALSDRKILASNGVVTFSLEIDRATQSIFGHIFIDSRGFVHSYEMMSVHKELIRIIRHTYESESVKGNTIDRANLVQLLRKEVMKYAFLLTGRTPIVMPILIER